MSRLLPPRIPLPTARRHFIFGVIRLFAQESDGGEMLVSKYHVVEYSMSASVFYREL
jgi:hypothetical protein